MIINTILNYLIWIYFVPFSNVFASPRQKIYSESLLNHQLLCIKQNILFLFFYILFVYMIYFIWWFFYTLFLSIVFQHGSMSDVSILCLLYIAAVFIFPQNNFTFVHIETANPLLNVLSVSQIVLQGVERREFLEEVSSLM